MLVGDIRGIVQGVCHGGEGIRGNYFPRKNRLEEEGRCEKRALRDKLIGEVNSLFSLFGKKEMVCLLRKFEKEVTLCPWTLKKDTATFVYNRGREIGFCYVLLEDNLSLFFFHFNREAHHYGSHKHSARL